MTCPISCRFGNQVKILLIRGSLINPGFVTWVWPCTVNCHEAPTSFVREEYYRMRTDKWCLDDLDGRSQFVLPTEPFMLHSLGGHISSRIGLLVDNSRHGSRNFQVHGGIALQETFRSIAKFGGAGMVFWFRSGSRSDSDKKATYSSSNWVSGCCKLEKIVRRISGSIASKEYPIRKSFDKIAGSIEKRLNKESDKLRFLPFVSTGGVLIPAFGTITWKLLEGPLGGASLKELVPVDQRPCDSENRGCSCLTVPDIPRKRYAVEPRTRIEFPVTLETIPGGERYGNFTSKILVGTGSRSMKIVKIKALKVYAFGFYIHPNSVCEKLGPKYASIPTGELNKCRNFYEDLLREDIHMTVRLVVSCNGVKINAVKDAFQKSLQNRLQKTNPNTDYHCLSKFGSIFQQEIPLPKGTTIDFHQTSDGNLITEIGGNRLGAVKSKELCRAFFDMYIGDVPVSEQTKEEIGQNVAGILGRC